MRKEEAVTLVKQTLGESFDETNFKRFVTELLKDYEQKDQVREGQYIKHAFQGFVLKYKILGTFTDASGDTLDVLEVALGKSSSLELARTAQRNFVADYLKSFGRKAALVAFVRPKYDDWRLSLVRLDHTLEVVEEKIKVKQEITPARRWSFLVGKTEGSHTAQSRFTDILVAKEKPTLAELQEAFSIETVTDEFFEKYKELFLQLKDHVDELITRDEKLRADFESKEISTADFAKKTLGQIVFLYFLQKKGWFGVAPGKPWGEGPKRFIRELFNRREKYGTNFFNDVLEPLFYEALAQDRGKESLYPRLNNCRMPFLNGGLFEPMNGYQWEITNITIPDEMFSNTFKTKEGDEGTGILDVFDRYNFTVNENEPLEKEVAVDPEMLGKVFENLLEINDRKDKGAFYTPREIVHYMCQESLITYLDTNTGDTIPKEDIEVFIRKGDRIIENDKIALEKIREKETKGFAYKGRYELLLPDSIITNAEQLDQLLKNIKVADPAVGSGAFPLGMINEIVRARKVLNIYLDDNVSDYELKLHTISHSIYGVDIDPGAVEIARLRLWLSLVVEENEPHPLPNLEHKIMQGNSLVSEYEGIKLFDPQIIRRKAATAEGEQGTLAIEGVEVAPVQGTLGVGETGSVIKMQELTALIDRYIGESQRSKKESLKSQIDQLKWEFIEVTLREKGEENKLQKVAELRRKNIRPFFIWELEFSDVFLSKGGFDAVIGNPPYILEDDNRSAFEGLHDHPCYEGKTDIWHLFTCSAIDLSRTRGVVSFIAKNQWLESSSAKKMRGKMYKETRIHWIVNFGANLVFDRVGQQTMMFLIQKGNPTGSHSIRYKKCLGTFTREEIPTLVGQTHSDEKLFCTTKEISSDFDPQNNLTFSESSLETLLDKIESKQNFNVDDSELVQGIIGGPDVAFTFTQDEYENADDVLKPYLKELHTNTKRYYTPGSNKYLAYVHRGNFTDKDFKLSATLKAKLLPYKEKLDNRREVKNNRLKWFHLWWPRDEEFFVKGPKLVWAKRTEGRKFTYTEDDLYGTANLFFIKSDRVNLKYLSALLNSKPMDFYMHHRLKHTGDLLQIDKNQFKKIPIHKPNNDGCMDRLVEEIIKLKKQNGDANTTSQEREIDELVMDLYELTEGEKEIIRNS